MFNIFGFYMYKLKRYHIFIWDCPTSVQHLFENILSIWVWPVLMHMPSGSRGNFSRAKLHFNQQLSSSFYTPFSQYHVEGSLSRSSVLSHHCSFFKSINIFTIFFNIIIVYSTRLYIYNSLSDMFHMFKSIIFLF